MKIGYDCNDGLTVVDFEEDLNDLSDRKKEDSQDDHEYEEFSSCNVPVPYHYSGEIGSISSYLYFLVGKEFVR